MCLWTYVAGSDAGHLLICIIATYHDASHLALNAPDTFWENLIGPEGRDHRANVVGRSGCCNN